MAFFTKRRSFTVFFVLGCVYASILFNLSFIQGTGEYWTNAKEDRIAHTIGAHYFVHDSWRFPLFSVPQIASPEGSNIVYTDSLPLIGLISKTVFKVTGLQGNYFGLWIFFCFPLLALFIALIIKEHALFHPAALFGAILLAEFSPAFLTRLEHAALMGHFLIAWSLLLYFKLLRSENFWPICSQFCLLLAIAILIQPYFVIMITPIFFAALLQGVKLNQISFRRLTFGTIALACTGLFIAFIAGIIGDSSAISNRAEGFGFYSMNLISPFLPLPDHLPSWISHHIPWDHRKVITWDATQGQYEGYNYLGAGVIALLLVHLIFSKKLISEAVKKHFILVIVFLGLFLYALSNKIYLGNWLLVDIHLPSALTALFSYFRVGARVFWPIYYALVVGLVILTFRRFRPRTATLLIISILCIQLWDIYPLQKKLITEAHTGFPKKLPSETWAKLLKEHAFFCQYPSFQCGGLLGKGSFPEMDIDMEFIRLAGQLEKPNNSAYLGRPSRTMEKEQTEAYKFDFQPEGLYLYGKSFRLGSLAKHTKLKTLCRECDYGIVCSQKWDTLSNNLSEKDFRPISIIPSLKYNLGKTIQFYANGDGINYLGKGWSNPEPWGIWSVGIDSELALALSEVGSETLLLTAKAFAFLPKGLSKKQITVLVNDLLLGEWTFSPENTSDIFKLTIPPEVRQKNSEYLVIKFVSKECISPIEVGLSKDTRKLSIGLINLKISTLEKSADNY